MWEAYDLGNEDFLWAGIPFMGGISGEQQAPCGAVSASAISLGLRHRCSLADKEKAEQARNTARHYSGKLVRHFTKQFGDITCRGLLGIDFSKPGEYQKFRESGVSKDKCEKYIQYIIEKLYEFEDEKDAGLHSK
jgi:C_GCAxxG_C_C family probable redox protein